ncbi:MAG: hypothetical protein GXP55_17475 [Deltaproteobacteria bacterium]|nr:hypothetical protein [Deltaproteobacteria bacterium]
MSKRITQLERAMEAALRPGRYIDYRVMADFTHGLEQVAADVKALVRGGHADEAIALFETFIAACHEKAEEVDDSDADLGIFVHDLFFHWVRARQSARKKPEETVKLLVGWMESDDAGFCDGLERDLMKVLNKRGLRAFATQARARLDAAVPDDGSWGSYPRRRWTTALKHIYVAQCDAEAYMALAEETTIDSEDCSAVAGILEKQGEFEQALAWVERGLKLAGGERHSFTQYELGQWRLALLPRLGRADEALAAAWAGFESSPGTYSYKTLMEFVPEGERDAWHDKAMAAAEEADLPDVIDLLVLTREVERLAARVDGASNRELERMSHYSTQPAAELLAKKHSATAARVFRAMGIRIVGRGKSKYYDAALGNFEHARDCYAAAGQSAKWDALVAEVRREHSRKHSFMPGFERVVKGGTGAEPSFLERARSRWPRGT